MHHRRTFALKPRPKKKRIGMVPVVLAVGLAVVIGGGAGAASLLDWETAIGRSGILVVENLPSGGSVLVDSRPVNRQAIRLSEGNHQVEILAPGLQTQVTPITIAANTTLRVQYEPQPLVLELEQRSPGEPRVASSDQPATPEPGTGILRLAVEPASAVFVDGESQGTQSSLSVSLTPGRHQVHLAASGYVDTTFVVEVMDQNTVTRTVTLRQQ